MWRNILVQSSYQLGLLIFLLKEGPGIFGCVDGSDHHFTIVFTAFVFCQVFNEFNAREVGDVFDPFKNLAGSPMFLLVIVVTIIAQYAIVEFGGDFTQTTHLTFEEWRATLLLGAGSIPVGFLMRLIPISEDPESFAGTESDMKAKKQISNIDNIANFIKVLLLPVLAAIIYNRFIE